MAAITASRRNVLFGALAMLLVFLALFSLHPTMPAKTKGFVQGLVGSSSPKTLFGPTSPPTNESSKLSESGKPIWNTDRWGWQNDLEEGYDMPTFDVNKLREYPPRNYEGPGQDVFATYFATREGTLHDPYFIAAQEFVYRLLWDPVIKTKHPVVVFVAPFVPQEQRDYFSAAGAIVRELELREFTPIGENLPIRLIDMFSKLEMWRQTDFSRIAYLDSDAVPWQNIDSMFDLAPVQKCKKKKLPKAAKKMVSSICEYVFAAWPEFMAPHMLNAGVMVLKPNYAMYAHLVRESQDQSDWLNEIFEQALIDHVFTEKGAFPASKLTTEYNGGFGTDFKKEDMKIVHAKVWSNTWGDSAWAGEGFQNKWNDMLKLYNSPEFAETRKADLDSALGEAKKPSAFRTIRRT